MIAILGFKGCKLYHSTAVETVLYDCPKQATFGHIGNIFALEKPATGSEIRRIFVYIFCLIIADKIKS